MSNMNEKLAVAKSAYEAALSNLDKARSDYENGAGKNYAEMKKNIKALKDQLEEYQRAYLAAKHALAAAMSESMGKTTDQVKAVMRELRDTEDLIEECQKLLNQAETSLVPVRLEASKAATRYQGAYESAANSWGKMNVLTVLAECGERLCAATAVASLGFDPREDARALRTQLTTREFMLKQLENMFDTYEGDKNSYEPEIGKCDLGAMSRGEIMTPGQMHVVETNGIPVIA